MVNQTTYDIILTGGGASGLLLALRLSQDAFFDDKQILIVDASNKDVNDRTWCFWSKSETFLTDVISHQWNTVTFKSDGLLRTENIHPYTYNHIQAIDFYKYALKEIRGKSNFTWASERVSNLTELDTLVQVETNSNKYLGRQVFNSILFSNDYKQSKRYPLIHQHFVGWKIKVPTEKFDPSTATFMDFDIPQQMNTRFMYVLPTSKTEALFEYTLFSQTLLNTADYEAGIKEYLHVQGIDQYEILDMEAGCIPMTCFPFWEKNSDKIHHIGIAGGWAKASTGYTFHNAILKTKQIVSQLKNAQRIDTKKRNRFWLYDLLLLDNLSKHNEKGAAMFAAMFKHNSFQNIFAFLDEETSVWQDLKTIWSMPKQIFIKALWRRLFGRN